MKLILVVEGANSPLRKESVRKYEGKFVIVFYMLRKKEIFNGLLFAFSLCHIRSQHLQVRIPKAKKYQNGFP